MRHLLLNGSLALAWTLLTGTFTEVNFLFGLALAFGLLLLLRDVAGSATYARKVWQVIAFALYFMRELVVANLHVAYEVITPRLNMRPAIVAVPLDLKRDLEITLLANLITLTPGTLSLEISDDKRTLYVHGMYVDDVDAFRQSIKQGFEKRVRELFE